MVGKSVTIKNGELVLREFNSICSYWYYMAGDSIAEEE